jgi:4-oxalocrotonate tautomerase
MPFVNIKVTGSVLAPEQVEHLQQGATALMAGVLRKKAELTAVLVEQVSCRYWTVGGKPVSVAAHLDVKVTEDTNTAAEKRRFIDEAMQLLRSALGADLNPIAYVVIHEVPKDAWGWGGLTQEHRAELA